MKNIKLFLLGALFLAFGCETNDESDLLYSGPNFVSFVEGGSSFTAVQGDANQFVVQIGVTTSSAQDRTYAIELDTDASTGTEGVHFNFDSKTITVPAGEFRGSVTITPIFDDLPTLGINLVLMLSTNETADYSILMHNTSILKYCESELTGTYTAVTSGTMGTDYPYTVTITEGDVNGEYLFSDITGGLYTDGYGATDQPATVMDNCGVLVLDNQPDTVYGGDLFNGTGTVNDDGTLTLEWSNGYGDFGTSVFTKN